MIDGWQGTREMMGWDAPIEWRSQMGITKVNDNAQRARTTRMRFHMDSAGMHSSSIVIGNGQQPFSPFSFDE